MRDIVTLFREFARLDLMRQDQGLSVVEHERWATLKAVLDERVGRESDAPPNRTRRSAKRVQTRINCSFSANEGSCDAVVSNLSTGGVFIRTDWPLPVDTLVQLGIRLEDTNREISVRGRVVSNHVNPSGDTAERGMGVRFMQVTPEALEQLSVLYSDELARDSKPLEPLNEHDR